MAVHVFWIGPRLLGGWVLAGWLERQAHSARVVRLVLAAAASLVFAYSVARRKEPVVANGLFLLLGVALFLREVVRMQRARGRRAGP